MYKYFVSYTYDYKQGNDVIEVDKLIDGMDDIENIQRVLKRRLKSVISSPVVNNFILLDREYCKDSGTPISNIEDVLYEKLLGIFKEKSTVVTDKGQLVGK